MGNSRNREIAAGLSRIADALEIKGDSGFKVMAYRRAARVLEDLPEDIARVAIEGRLREISGIGKGIAQKIEEHLDTGTMRKLLEATAGVPEGLFDLLNIPGLGARTIHIAYRELGIRSLADLRQVISDGRLASLPGLGPKKAESIRNGIELFERAGRRIPIDRATRLAEDVVAWMKQGPPAERISPAGSLRRRRESVGDLDILAASDGGSELVEHFTRYPGVTRILARGGTRGSVHITGPEFEYQVDLRIVPKESWGAALQYFTGSKAHNVRLRSLAKDMGLKISEYGVYRGERREAGATEEDCYRALGLDWIPPEMREDRGEIRLAREGDLPRLIEEKDLRGDLHVHSVFSDGSLTIEELASAALRRGYEYLAICDHSQSVDYAGGLSPARLLEQQAEIDRLNRKLKGLRLLKGAEVDILSDGKLDYPDEILGGLDVVVASIHSGFRKNVTRRMIAAMRNPHVTAIAHPTGRLLSGREGYAVDIESVAEAAAEFGVALELNACVDRLDLDENNLRRAVARGGRISIGSDSHHSGDMDMIRFGIGIARRAWLTKEHVLNTRPWKNLHGRREQGPSR